MAEETKSEVVAPAAETQPAPAPLAPWVRLAGTRGIGEVVARIRARLGKVQR